MPNSTLRRFLLLIWLFLWLFLFAPSTIRAPVLAAERSFQTGWWVHMYEGGSGSKLATYASDGNTLVMGVGHYCSDSQLPTILSFLDDASKYGVKVIVELNCQQNTPYTLSKETFTAAIKAIKNHPALFGYLLGDEPEMQSDRETKHQYLLNNPGYYKLAREADPNHPVVISFDRAAHDAEALIFYDVLEIAGVHTYPFWSYPNSDEFNNHEGRELYDTWKAGLEAAKSRGKDFIATAQGFGNNTMFPYRNPTYKELRYQVFTAMVVGVDKILFWMDQWGRTSGTHPLVAQMVGQIQGIGAEMNNGVTNDPRLGVSVTDRNQLVYRYGISGTSQVILAVNIANRGSQAGATLSNVQFTLPSGVNVSQVEVLHENRSIPVANRTFSDTLSPFAVHIYRFSSGATASPTPTRASTPTPTPPSSLPGDLDRDGDVDIYDYNRMVSDFGKTGSSGWIAADIDKNGKVDIYDYNVLVENFGKTMSLPPGPLNFYGVEFAGPRSYPELASLGIMNPITDVDINNPNNWEGTIDEAISTARSLRSQYPNFKPILWQKGLSDNLGWNCNGVNNVGKAFINYLNTKNYWDDILAIYGMQEVLGVNTNSCSSLDQIKSVVAQIKQLSGGRAKIYHKLYSDTSCDLDPNCLIKKFGFADGLCDYCGVLYHPYRYSPREFRKTQMLSALEKDLNLIKSVPPGQTLNSFMAYLCTIHWPELWVYGTGLYMPSPAEMSEGASSVINYVSSKGYRVDGFSWYGWDNHPVGWIGLGQYNGDNQRAGRMNVVKEIGKLR